MSKSDLTIPKSPVLDPTAQLIKELVKQRGTLKGRLTKLSAYVNSVQTQLLDRTKRAEIALKIQGASTLLADFNQVQMKLDGVLPELEMNEQLDERETFENRYYSIIAQANCMLEQNTSESNTNDLDQCTTYQSVRLPTINLPTFDGSYEQWLEFKNTYLSLVHTSKNISNIQKFHYLKSSLKGTAELVINALEFTSDNYFVAWELLMNRFNNSRLLTHNHVKSLFTIPQLTKESPVLLRKLIDSVLKNLRSLKLLGEPTEYWDTLLIYMIVSKLDHTTEREWEKYRSNLMLSDQQQNSETHSIQVEDLLQFLKARADMLETLHLSHNKQSNVFKTSHGTPRVHCNLTTSKTDKTIKRSCLLCNANHPLYSCQKFLDLTIESRINFVTQNKLCENCLRPAHTADSCRFGPCRKCNSKHNTLIHQDPCPTAATQISFAAVPESRACVSESNTLTHYQTYSSQANNNIDVQCAHASYKKPVLLSTALVKITDELGKEITCRVLLDSGSQCCFIRKAICDQINTPLIQSIHKIQGIGNSTAQSFQSCKITIHSLNGDYTARLQCLVLPQITPNLPSVCSNLDKLNIPKHIMLADPCYLDNNMIDILVGADVFWDLLCDGKIQLECGPFLHNTKLGWIISGPINNCKYLSNVVNCNYSHSIDAQLQRFWELEEVPTCLDTRTEIERSCENHFVSTTERDAQGRFIVAIPFKESPCMLGETYTQAYRRFISLEKRLLRSPTCKKLYTEFMDEYIKLGHMQRVEHYDKVHYFMPHFCVFNENSTTTKLRVVFDASAKSSTNKSLNDLQIVGPPIQGDLMSILLRFREHTYIACADVEKMYRQVLIKDSQRDLQLVLWRSEPTAPLEIFRLNTVTYGTASAPFLSVRCLQQLGMECSDPDVKRIIAQDIYVDDMITGSNDKTKLLQSCEKTADILKTGCFPLRKWEFNFVNNEFSLSAHESKNLSLGEQTQSKTLGLSWVSQTDELNYQVKIKLNSNIITKRLILSTISQIFDPLGLLSATIIKIKILLQKMWLLKIDWDSALPDEVSNEFTYFLNDLNVLNTLRIPRHTFSRYYTRSELHIFTDASQKAYGACAYIRTITQEGNTMVRLLCAKGKVAPLKPLTIPRLELCGALVGARLCSKIVSSLRCQLTDITLWTDSTIVLGWLSMEPRQLHTFVQNRVVEVKELIQSCSWRHVATNENPADLVSRGVDLKTLKDLDLWWEGPRFLHDPNFTVGTRQVTQQEMEELPEVKSLHALSSISNDCSNQSLFPFSRFSQFSRMQRTAAYVRRFIYNTRKCNVVKRSGALCVEELREAVDTLALLSQRESFTEYEQIDTNKSLGKSNLLKLNVFMDAKKIIRVGGRLANVTHFEYDKRHPILLSSKHQFTHLLFRSEHKRLLHAAPQFLLFTIRESWWPIGGRNLAKKVVHECIVCTRLRGKTLTPIMGNLPVERLAFSYPFVCSGVDYFGPVNILNRKGRGAKVIKSYVCLFVCFTTRAIHLELVGDLSTDAYLLALKRFISRRGKPAKIFSDNGRNFTGLMTEFTRFLNSCAENIKEFASISNIEFSFIPPYSPHFGGLWEAGVKSCKHHIRRVVGNANFTFEEFSTVLTQVEAILNSRPLSPMSADPNDFSPLTPAHFLVGRPLTAPVTRDVGEILPHRLTRYERVEQARQHFWNRWSKEYVSELQTRTKWIKAGDTLQDDTLVLIKEDNTLPLKWSMGRVISTHPGRDGVSRVASIRMATGNVIRRAFSKICPLPVTCDPASDV